MTGRRHSHLRPQVLIVICMMVVLGGCGKRANIGNTASVGANAGTGVHSYSTRFLETETPISERKNWIGGEDAGNRDWRTRSYWRGKALWGNVQTSGGLAFGMDEPTQYGDPTAILTGAWGSDQTVTATVAVGKTPRGRCCHEVELRLRTTISPGSITGYEAYCSVMPDQPYCNIARWNGPNGSWWNIQTESSTYLVTGDVIKATVTGTNPTIITLYRNGKQILQAMDTGKAGGGFGAYGPWTSGNPGIGFYDNPDTDWKAFGFSSFNATDRIQGGDNMTSQSD